MIKLSQVYELLCKAGIPVTYGQFNGPKEDIPDPPYIAYYETRSKNFGADNIVYAEQLSVIAELYTSFCRDLALEKKIKQLLTEAGIFYDTNHSDIHDEQFTAGNVESAYAAVKISSKYASGEACGKLYLRIKDRSFKTFSISRGFVYNFMPVGSRVITDINTMESYVATNITHYLSAANAYAELSAEAPTESEWDFSGALTQQVNKRIAENIKYHGVALSKKEGLTCDGVGGKITMADGEVKYYSKPSGTASDTPAVAALSDSTETSAGSEAATVEKQRCITIRDAKIIFNVDGSAGNVGEENSVPLLEFNSGSENAQLDSRLQLNYYGDGLFLFGGDLFCTYDLLGTKFTETSLRLEYEKYYILVTWTNADADGNERTSPKWERIYKEASV